MFVFTSSKFGWAIRSRCSSVPSVRVSRTLVIGVKSRSANNCVLLWPFTNFAQAFSIFSGYFAAFEKGAHVLEQTMVQSTGPLFSITPPPMRGAVHSGSEVLGYISSFCCVFPQKISPNLVDKVTNLRVIWSSKLVCGQSLWMVILDLKLPLVWTLPAIAAILNHLVNDTTEITEFFFQSSCTELWPGGDYRFHFLKTLSPRNSKHFPRENKFVVVGCEQVNTMTTTIIHCKLLPHSLKEIYR